MSRTMTFNYLRKEYNFYSVDEFGDCNEEKEQKCWIEQWIKEQHLNE